MATVAAGAGVTVAADQQQGLQTQYLSTNGDGRGRWIGNLDAMLSCWYIYVFIIELFFFQMMIQVYS